MGRGGWQSYDRMRNDTSPRRTEIERKWSPLIEGWIYILLEPVWIEGDISVSPSDQENPQRTEGYSAEEWTASLYYWPLHSSIRPPISRGVTFEPSLCAATRVQRLSKSSVYTAKKTHAWRPQGPITSHDLIRPLLPLRCCPDQSWPVLTSPVSHSQSA